MKYFILIFFSSLFFSHKTQSQNTANYNVSLTTIWNSSNHTLVPSGAHWSALVGATHNLPNQFFELGIVSPNTDGIKDIAELGNSNNFRNEVNTAISQNKADQWIDAGGLGNAIGTFFINDLIVNENFPLITLVSMVAPSPDWFIGINSLNLRSGNLNINNGWKDTFTIDIFAYNAGTDDGSDYSSINSISNPRVGVFKLVDSPINGNKMGKMTFTYMSSTLNNSTAKLNNFKIFPNPTKGTITITNVQDINLKSVELFTVLGKLSHKISIEQNPSKLDFNLTNLNKGLYFLKLNTLEGKRKIEKIIIE